MIKVMKTNENLIIIHTPNKVTVWSTSVTKELNYRKVPSGVAKRLFDTLHTVPDINNVLYHNENINHAIARCVLMQSNISFLALQDEMHKYTKPY